jgi:hypothetical protein
LCHSLHASIEEVLVRKLRGIGLVLLAFEVVLAGCDSGSKTETVEFKATDTSQFKDMQDAMTKNLKAKPSERFKGADPPQK